MVEGAPLLREYRLKRLIEGSNPSLSARHTKRPLVGRFVCLAEQFGSTNSPGAMLDRRRLALERAARKGGPMDRAQALASRQYDADRRMPPVGRVHDAAVAPASLPEGGSRVAGRHLSRRCSMFPSLPWPNLIQSMASST